MVRLVEGSYNVALGGDLSSLGCLLVLKGSRKEQHHCMEAVLPEPAESQGFSKHTHQHRWPHDPRAHVMTL